MNIDKYKGKDNYGKSKLIYIEKLKDKSDKDLFEECKSKIWLSAFANNNPRSDYHWHVDACYDECSNRNKIEIYNKAYNENIASVR